MDAGLAWVIGVVATAIGIIIVITPGRLGIRPSLVQAVSGWTITVLGVIWVIYSVLGEAAGIWLGVLYLLAGIGLLVIGVVRERWPECATAFLLMCAAVAMEAAALAS